MSVFPSDVVDAVLAHMNSDHRDDNILITRAFSGREAITARMTDFDKRGATWHYEVDGEESELHIPWPTELTDRNQVRAEIVALYSAACQKLGVEARPH
ncbi:MAG TPA: DUF2470 domain-containing protein [Pseudolysinimonas sp.]|nr:DUF2470 domain-containing protein [Pseudolysinimonas sp.]